MTYVHEMNAQFAKESMACQSLDNDEILNVRWATEDPNPVSKVAEKRRLEEIGRDAIQAKMDPRIVDAMRAVRALEDGVELEDDGQHEEYVMEEGEDGTRAKRPRLTFEAEGDAHHFAEEAETSAMEPEPDFQDNVLPSQQQPPPPSGLLSADALEGLKYFAEIRKRSAASAAAPARAKSGAPPHQAQIALGLAGYGSDEDE